MATTRAPLFVRLTMPVLDELDARIRSDGRTKQAVVEDLLATQLQVSTAVGVGDAADEILDLAGVAALLRLDEAEVLARIATGDFPARRFGSAWRCSRTAVIGWLHGTDTVSDRPTGFAPA